MGAHPLWQFLRAVFRMTRPPLVLGGVCLFAGYIAAWAARRPSIVPAELRAFHRREQLDRLRRLVSGGARRVASAEPVRGHAAH